MRQAASPDAALGLIRALVPRPEDIDVTITPNGTAFTMTCSRCNLDQPMDAFYVGAHHISRTRLCEACREEDLPAPRACNAARSRAAARLIEEHQGRYHELVEQELAAEDDETGRHGVALRLAPHPKEET